MINLGEGSRAAGGGGRSGSGGATALGAGGTAIDAAETQPSGCAFGALWNAMVEQAAVIGYCHPVAICLTSAATTDAGTSSCSPIFDLGNDTLTFEHGTLIVSNAYVSTGCEALVFDDEGRLIDGRVSIAGWSACRWPSYAGKSYYYYCVSE